MKNSFVLSGGVLLAIFTGCVSPDFSESNRVDLDDESIDGGISATDVRSVASKMCPSILASLEGVGGERSVKVKVADLKNSSRFFIDKNIFIKKFCVELNKHGNGKVRFLNWNESASAAREEVLRDRMVENVRNEVKKLASALVSDPVITQAKAPIKIAVVPTLNANLVNMNADSFSAMLRSEIGSSAGSKITFLMPGVTEGADYWLAGQLYPESMKKEGIINLANYIEVLDQRIKDGKDLYVPQVAIASVTPVSTTVAVAGSKEDVLVNMLRNPNLYRIMNCDKMFNAMLVRPSDRISVWERTIVVDKRISDKSGNARYVLSGEISGLSQNASGKVSDYLLITLELVDPESNELVWQDSYEVKRASKVGTVYR